MTHSNKQRSDAEVNSLRLVIIKDKAHDKKLFSVLWLFCLISEITDSPVDYRDLLLFSSMIATPLRMILEENIWFVVIWVNFFGLSKLISFQMNRADLFW